MMRLNKSRSWRSAHDSLRYVRHRGAVIRGFVTSDRAGGGTVLSVLAHPSSRTHEIAESGMQCPLNSFTESYHSSNLVMVNDELVSHLSAPVRANRSSVS